MERQPSLSLRKGDALNGLFEPRDDEAVYFDLLASRFLTAAASSFVFAFQGYDQSCLFMSDLSAYVLHCYKDGLGLPYG